MTALRTALLFLLLALTGLPLAVAEDDAPARLFRSPDLGGYAFEAALPAGWRLVYADVNVVTLASNARRADGPRFEIALATMKLDDKLLAHHGYEPGTMSLEALDRKIRENGSWYRDQKTFHEGRVTLAGLSMHERHLGPTTYQQSGGEMVEATAGVARAYSAITPDLVRIDIRVNAYLDRSLAEMPMLTTKAYAHDLVLRSLRLVKTSDLTAAQKAALPTVHRTGWVRVSARRDYRMDLQATMLLPASFEAATVVDDQAGGGREQGTYAIQLTPPTPEGREKPLGVGILIFEGLPVAPQSKGSLLATLDARVQGVLPKGRLASTEEISHPGLAWLASQATRRGSSTNATVVRTYTEERADGTAATLKAWTAGGLTGAVHLILLGDAADFDALESAFASVIEMLRVSLR